MQEETGCLDTAGCRWVQMSSGTNNSVCLQHRQSATSSASSSPASYASSTSAPSSSSVFFSVFSHLWFYRWSCFPLPHPGPACNILFFSCCIIQSRVTGAAISAKTPRLPWPKSFSSFGETPRASQDIDTVPPACPGPSPGPLPVGICFFNTTCQPRAPTSLVNQTPSHLNPSTWSRVSPATRRGRATFFQSRGADFHRSRIMTAYACSTIPCIWDFCLLNCSHVSSN